MSTVPERASAAPARLVRAARMVVVSTTMAAAVCVALLSVSVWRDGSAYIEDVSSTLMGIRKLVSGDSEHYLAIADALREGDWSMSHVAPTGGADRAHRQPGYPALLAVAETLGVQRAPELARVNLALLVASLWIAFLGARIATGSALAGLVAAVLIYDARFLAEIATQRLLTEPLYVAVALAAAVTCLSYVSRASAVSLLGAAVFAATAYLVRVNGLFLAPALGVAMVFADIRRARRANPEVPAVDLTLHLPLAAYAAALALFVLITTPSWFPRVVHTGNPVYHGYLPNFLWVDEYARAHSAGPPQFSMATYVAEHDATDAVRRLSWGARRVFWETPRDKFGLIASVALLASVVIVFALRDSAGITLVCAGILQAIPLAWTALANPARRLAATALLPFAVLVVACAVAAMLRRARKGSDPISPGNGV